MTNNQGQQALRFAPVVVVLVVLGIALVIVVGGGETGLPLILGQ